MECRILGPVELWHQHRRIRLDGAKQRTVVAVLAMAADRLVPDSRLSDLLWGESPPTTSGAQIYTYVSRLRRALGPQVQILRRSPGYVLAVDGLRLDAVEFEETAQRGQMALAAGRVADAARLLGAALDSWRGPALMDVSPYLGDSERPRLEEARLATLESRIEADLALGRHHAVLSELIGLVRLYPLRERFRAQLMTTFYRCDRQADALRLYDEGRRLLADELGIGPGALLRGVHLDILSAAPRLHSGVTLDR